MRDSKTIRVLIANDLPVTREGLAAFINRHEKMEVVAQTGSASQLFELIGAQAPNVLIMDLSLEGSDTLPLIQQIRESYPATPILIFSNYEGSEDIYRALRAGARGYLPKNASDSELLEAIQTLSTG